MEILSHFRTIEELTKTLSREQGLLSEMFEKRKLMKFPLGLALELVGGNETRLRRLVDYGVLVETGNAIEIESDYLNFFEEVLNVNEEISVLSVQECINPLWMESRQYSRIRLSLEMLRENDQIVNILRRIAERNGLKKTARTEAEPLTDEDLQEHVQRLKEVDPAEVWNAFSASSYNLFDFILRYDYKAKRDIEDHAALFCQLVILHPDECRMTGKYATYQDIEYPIIYAK